MNIARKDWPAALCALPAGEVKETVRTLLQHFDVRDVALPQAGLGLLNLRDGAFHESYFIGEIPVARADVILRTRSGEEARGGAVIVDDRSQFARSIAILDAVMSARLAGWEQAATLVQRGVELRGLKQIERKQQLAATRVDFSLLGQDEDEE